MKKYIKKSCNIIIVAIIVMSIVLMYVGSLYTKTGFLRTNQDNASVGDGVTLSQVSYSSRISSYRVDWIYPDNDSSSYGWCINRGASLSNKSSTISNISNGYGNSNAGSSGSNQLDWLYDNICRFGSSVPYNEIEFYKQNLQNILTKHGGGNISNYTDNDIFAIEQLAIWYFTSNQSSTTFPRNEPLFNALVAEANANSGYRHVTPSVQISKENAQVSNGVVGPFSCVIMGEVYFKSNLGTIYTDSACTQEYVNGSSYVGDVYLKSNGSSSAYAYISWGYYSTSVTRYDTKGAGSTNQPFTIVEREVDGDYIEFEQSNEGAYRLSIVKKSASEYEGITDKSQINLSNKSTGIGGVGFTLTQKYMTSSGYSDVISKSVTTTSGEAVRAVFGVTEIVENGIGENAFDVYTVSEVSVPDGYEAIDLSGVTFNVYKKLEDSTYMIDYVTINSGGTEISRIHTGTESQDVVDIDNDGTWDFGIEVNASGMDLCITIIDPVKIPDEGNFKLRLVKFEKGTETRLAGAEFNIKIVDNNNNTVLDTTRTTNSSGEISCNISDVEEADIIYTVTITETNPPIGYNGIDGPITFKAVTVLDEDANKYVLREDGDITSRTDDGYVLANAKKVEVGKNEIRVEAENDVIPNNEGSFRVRVVKYEKGTSTKLPGAEFNVKIVDNNNKTVLDKTETTNSSGEIVYNIEEIEDANLTYTITLTEVNPPAGYIGISGPITFKAVTTLDEESHTYELRADGDITNKNEDGYELSNAKKVEIGKNEIKIEAENRTTSIDIHKGVKSVENQDSGYYAVADLMKIMQEEQEKKDNETPTKYEDEKTGKEYTEIEMKDIYHDWVIETTIPESVSEYTRYVVTDPIDTTKLDFSGIERVKVELISQSGTVTNTLKKDEDYQVEYDSTKGILTVTYIDEKKAEPFHGEFLSSRNTIAKGTKIRLTFNTTFKVNPETGKLVVLEGVIKNAENKAKLTYDNGNGTDMEKESETPEVHTGAVSVFKYEDTNNNGKHDEGEKALVGAEFKIALSEKDAKEGKFIKINGKELVAISNEHGIATFIGLSFGGDAKDDEKNLKNGLYRYDWEKASRDYYIVETKSPAGYEKLTDVIKVTVSKHSSEIIDLTDKINEMESVGNRPLKFDLALRKWVTHAIVTENGQSIIYETGHRAEDDPEAIVKVDLKKSKLGNVKVQFKYSIRVTNEGEIAGEAREITDHIPAGLKFVQEDNPGWTTTSDERIVKTRLLEGVTLQPGESAEVEILLTWINSEDNMGVMINTAEISEDYNKYGVHDIDSTPGNYKWGEDDIDDAPVMITVKTGSEIIGYVSIGVGFMSIITIGAVLIKRRILE